MKLKGSDPNATAFVKQMLVDLENSKKTLPAMSREEAHQHVEAFALRVFAHADNEDRSGKASKKTVLSFVAAYIFLEITSQFDDLMPDIEEKIKYAKWKAADISKALKDGRTPLPGSIEEQEEAKLKAENPGDDDDDSPGERAPTRR